MSKFGPDRTNIGEIENAVTPKQAPRRDEYANFLGAAFQAAKTSVETYSKYKRDEWRKEEEGAYRKILGMPEEQTTASLEEFRKNVSKYNQLVEQGRAMRAEALLQEDLQRRITKEPFLADEYRKVASQLSSDYTAIRTYITGLERQASDAAAAKNKDLAALLKETHTIPEVPMPDGSWQIVPLEDITDEQRRFLEVTAYTERKRIASQEELFKIAEEGRSERGEMRAERSAELAEDAAYRANYKFRHDIAMENHVAATTAKVNIEFNKNMEQILKDPASSNEEKMTRIKGLATQAQQALNIALRYDSKGRVLPVTETTIQSAMNTYNEAIGGYTDLFIGENSTPEMLKREIEYRTYWQINSFGYDGILLSSLNKLLGPGFGSMAFDGAFRLFSTQAMSAGANIGKTIEQQKIAFLEAQNRAYSEDVAGLPKAEKEAIFGGNAQIFDKTHTPGTEQYNLPTINPDGYVRMTKVMSASYASLDKNDKAAINAHLESGEIINQINKLPAAQKKQAADYAFNLYKENLRQFMKSNRTQGNGFEYDEQTNTLVPDDPADQGLADKYNQYLDYVWQMDQLGSNPSPNKKTLISTQLWAEQ